MPRHCLALVAFGLCAAPLLAEDLPQWRGANGDSAGAATGEPERIHLAGLAPGWKPAFCGGYGGIAVAGGRVYVMDRRTMPREVERVVCLDAATGKQRWVREYDVNYHKMD